MAILYYILGIAFLALAGLITYVSIARSYFDWFDQIIMVMCLTVGFLLIWSTFRNERWKREERRRQRAYRRRKIEPRS